MYDLNTAKKIKNYCWMHERWKWIFNFLKLESGNWMKSTVYVTEKCEGAVIGFLIFHSLLITF